jgi:hypothetical protein
LNNNGIGLALADLEDSLGRYEVSELTSRENILLAIDNVRRVRGASAQRFRYLVDVAETNESEIVGRFFLVTNLSSHLADIVYIAVNGSMASTRRNFAIYGRPDKVMYAVFVAGKCAINFGRHFISNYHKVKDLPSSYVDVMSVTRDGVQKADVPTVTPEASPTWAVDVTKNIWESKGLCEDDNQSTSERRSNTMSTRIEKNTDDMDYLKKQFYDRYTLLRKNQDMRVKFLQLMQEFDTIQQQKAVAESEAWRQEARIQESNVMTIAVPSQGHKRKKARF